MVSKVSQKFVLARTKMVKDQLADREITDRRVLKAMGETPRELFTAASYRRFAYDDGPLPIGEGQTISQPYIVGLMTQLLRLKGKEKVLEIGTGSGYQAAVLSKLVRKVYSVERHQKLLKKARKVFQKLNLDNIETKLGDGSQGWEEKGPFEAIMVTAAAEKPPQELIGQLKERGRLVMPIGTGWQRLIRLTKKKDKIKEEDFGGCVFVPLISRKVKKKKD